MLRRSLPAILFFALVAARPAVPALTDDEPSNDSIGTAAVQIVPTAAVTTDGGEFTLVFDDVDYVGVGNLSVGDIVVVSTTPVDDEKFEDPDTFVGLFTSGGSKECENDDSLNNLLGNPPSAGYGSLCRFVIDSAGTWYVGVTGSGNSLFDGTHFHEGVYSLHVTINAIDPPTTPTPTATPTATPIATPTVSPTVTPTAILTSTPTVTPTAVPTSTPTVTPTAVPTSTPTPTPTPEPGLLLQLAAGMLGLAILDKRRRNANCLSECRVAA